MAREDSRKSRRSEQGRGETGSQSLSSADDRQAPQRSSATLPALGAKGMALFLWRQLTSMQTALLLLMLLAIAAIPGSVYPQRNVNAQITEAYIAEHGRTAEIMDAVGLFDVFSSPWFSAIYLLLFVSLVGCVIPRLLVHLRQIRSRPPRTPTRLTRFTGYTRVELPSADADAIAEQARRTLRRGRYRTDALEEGAGARSVTAERGYLRETGNLIFHVALLGVLVGVAGGGLTQYRGQITVIEGAGFSNSLTQYDSFESGAWYKPGELPPFQFTLDEFRAEYDTTPNEHRFGQPLLFEADVTVTSPETGTFAQTLRVNEPLHIGGQSMFLLGNGYAPEITVRDPEGNVVAQGPIITIPSGDMGYTSALVLKAPDAKPQQMAVVGFFLPTGVIDEKGPHSQFPALIDPQLALTVYTGDLGLDEGIPQNAYQIDVSSLTPVTDASGTQSLLRLAPGQQADLPDGSSVSFDGVRRFAAFDIKHDPFQVFTLISALSAAGGLILSLFIPRRRVWVRATPLAGGGAVLEVAGLARSDDDALEGDVRALAEKLGAPPAAPPTARPEAPSEASAQVPSTPSRPADPAPPAAPGTTREGPTQ